VVQLLPPAEMVQSGPVKVPDIGGIVTITCVQPPQLFCSFDSVITPEFVELLLSAQTLIE